MAANREYLIQEMAFDAGIDCQLDGDVVATVEGRAILCMIVRKGRSTFHCPNHATVSATVRGLPEQVNGKLSFDSLVSQAETLLRDMAQAYNDREDAA